MLDSVLFYFFSVLAIGGGVLTITRRSVVIAGVWLIASLLGVAGLFLLQGAEFLFIAQLILYVGGIVLLFLIAIMLVRIDASAPVRRFRRGWPAVLCASLAFAAELFILLSRGQFASFPAIASPASNTQVLADTLLSQYLVAFELASVLLVAAIVGAVIMGQKRKGAGL